MTTSVLTFTLAPAGETVNGREGKSDGAGNGATGPEKQALPLTDAAMESGGCLRQLQKGIELIAGHRHHREAWLTDEQHALEDAVGLHGGERDGMLERAHRLDLHGAPVFSLGGRIRKGLARDLRQTDDLLALVRVIEEAAVALLHGAQVVARSEV